MIISLKKNKVIRYKNKAIKSKIGSRQQKTIFLVITIRSNKICPRAISARSFFMLRKYKYPIKNKKNRQIRMTATKLFSKRPSHLINRSTIKNRIIKSRQRARYSTRNRMGQLRPYFNLINLILISSLFIWASSSYKHLFKNKTNVQMKIQN